MEMDSVADHSTTPGRNQSSSTPKWYYHHPSASVRASKRRMKTPHTHTHTIAMVAARGKGCEAEIDCFRSSCACLFAERSICDLVLVKNKKKKTKRWSFPRFLPTSIHLDRFGWLASHKSLALSMLDVRRKNGNLLPIDTEGRNCKAQVLLVDFAMIMGNDTNDSKSRQPSRAIDSRFSYSPKIPFDIENYKVFRLSCIMRFIVHVLNFKSIF